MHSLHHQLQLTWQRADAFNGRNPGGLPDILSHFRRAGYATAALGKIHCPEYWVEDECDVFHETCNCSVGGRSTACLQFLREGNKLHLEDHGAMPEFGDRGRQNTDYASLHAPLVF